MKPLLVIPVYNHARTLRGVAEQALAAGFPVLVVDDGSTDEPLATLANLALDSLCLTPNRGKGSALLAAAAWAEAHGYDALLTLDADGQHDPAEAHRLVDIAASHWPCLVLGVRSMEGADVPASSRFGRSFSNFWVRLETGQHLSDTQSGFRLYPVAALRGVRFLTRRYTFEIEALVRAAWAGYPVREAPVSVDYAPAGGRVTHFRKFRDNARLTALHTFLVTRSLLPKRRRIGTVEPSVSLKEVFLHPTSLLRRIATEHASPLELATAVGSGVFLGALPIIPFGLVTILYIHHRLHLNRLAGMAASNLCVAPFVPWVCIQVGHLLRHGTWWADYTRQGLLFEIHLRLWEWLLGALVVGPLLGLLAALPTYFLVRALRR